MNLTRKMFVLIVAFCALARTFVYFFDLVVPMTVDRLRLFALGAVIVLIFKKGVFKYVSARKQSVGIIIFRFVKKSSFLKTEINSKQKYACLFVVCLLCKKIWNQKNRLKEKT